MMVRPATASDFPRVLPLMQGFGRVQLEGAEARFVRILEHPEHCILVAEQGQTLVGYAWVQGYGARLRSGEESARLHDLFTLTEMRGKGVGRALLEAVNDWCKARGTRYLEWQANQQAATFYEKLGYKGDPCPQTEYPFFEIDFYAQQNL